MSKIIKFVKENKILTFALAVVVLSFVFLALPGQYVHKDRLGADYVHYLSGYQFFFNTYETLIGGESTAIGTVSATGIAIFVMLILALGGLIFSKKSSFVSILTGLDLFAVSIMFFCVEKSATKVYGMEAADGYPYASWVPYLLGAFILVAALLVIYRSVMVMKDELKHPTTKSSSGPTYNYLKK